MRGPISTDSSHLPTCYDLICARFFGFPGHTLESPRRATKLAPLWLSRPTRRINSNHQHANVPCVFKCNFTVLRSNDVD